MPPNSTSPPAPRRYTSDKGVRPRDVISIRDARRAKVAFLGLTKKRQRALGEPRLYALLDRAVCRVFGDLVMTIPGSDRARLIKLGFLTRQNRKLRAPRDIQLIMKYLPPPPHKGGVLQLD